MYRTRNLEFDIFLLHHYYVQYIFEKLFSFFCSNMRVMFIFVYQPYFSESNKSNLFS